MRTLILMVGTPASGKTTFANELGDKFLIPVVSSDLVREQLYGDESIQGNPEEVFDEVYRWVRGYLLTGACILDATHCSRWNRWAAVAKTCPDKVIYIIMNQDIEKAKKQNAARERKVPDNVIDRMAKNLSREFPKSNECYNLHIYNYDDPTLLDVLKNIK